jgi:hypothetical protein
MTEVGSWKWIEVGLLGVAAVAFGWWQLRDVAREQQRSRDERARQARRDPPPDDRAQEPPP